MKVLLITPSNISHMPYIDNYIQIMQDEKVEYDIVNWDRQNLEKNRKFTYKDKQNTMGKNFFQYLQYTFFIKKILKNNQYDVVVIFGLQLLFFLQKLIEKNKKTSYILDIRDKNKIVKFMNLDKVFSKFKMIVLSSEAYKEWLPERNYYINHNSKLGLSVCNQINKSSWTRKNSSKIIITSLGSLRDLKANITLINSLKNNDLYCIDYFGDGEIWNQMNIHAKKCNNVVLHGRYEKKNEKDLAMKSTFINVVRFPDSENNKTALPNRLYLGLELGIPLLSFQGTYLSEIIKQYNLGLVLDETLDIDDNIQKFISNFDKTKFDTGRRVFMQEVEKDNKDFKNSFIKLIKEEK